MTQRDDIILGGKDREEHNRTFEKVLHRGKEHWNRFNREKNQYDKTEITFLVICSHKKKDPRKIEAVINCKEPKSKEDVRSFLGMTGYLDNFIRNYATLSAAQRNLKNKIQTEQLRSI